MTEGTDDGPLIICTICGHSNLAEVRWCAGCWSPLNRVSAAPGQEVILSAERERRKKLSSRIRLRILGSTAAAIGVVLAVQFSNITIPILNPPSQFTRAPELQEISGWINTEPLTLESLQGKVVLLDFWTYTCVNCIRTLPVLKRWYDRYAEYGLVIVGVHSPEFEFEKIRENLEAAIAQYGVNWPIAQDNDFATWDAYNNTAWPSKYLIDNEGVIRYSHFGEGAYVTTEQTIRELLHPDISFRSVYKSTGTSGDIGVDQHRTPYLGEFTRQGGPLRFLDLYLRELHSHASCLEELVRQVFRIRPGDCGRAFTRVRV